MIKSRFVLCIFAYLFLLNDVLCVWSHDVKDISDDLIIKPRSDTESYNKKILINAEVPDTKYSKDKSHENYKKSSIKQKAIYDINNYGLNSNTPYQINNKFDKNNLNLDENKNDKKISNNFYIMLQSNALLPNTFNLKESKYLGKAFPSLPSVFPASVKNFLPDATREGNYAILSGNNIIIYPYISLGIKTNDIFRFEIVSLYANVKLQNHKNDKGINYSYIDGYDSSSRFIEMNFKQQIYLLNSYVDLKLSSGWLYLGAGVGVVNNNLNKFTMNIKDTSNKKYTLTSIIDRKAVYKRATMVSIGFYSKIYTDTFIDLSIKKMSLNKISTLKDYVLIDWTNNNSAIITMNTLEFKTNPYLVSIGVRTEF